MQNVLSGPFKMNLIPINRVRQHTIYARCAPTSPCPWTEPIPRKSDPADECGYHSVALHSIHLSRQSGNHHHTMAVRSPVHGIAAHYRGNPHDGLYADSAFFRIAGGIHHGAGGNYGHLVSGRTGYLHGRHSNVCVRCEWGSDQAKCMIEHKGQIYS